jgi:hypothetical protein
LKIELITCIKTGFAFNLIALTQPVIASLTTSKNIYIKGIAIIKMTVIFNISCIFFSG